MKALFFLVTIFMLSACGQKGPLYLPGSSDAPREVPHEIY